MQARPMDILSAIAYAQHLPAAAKLGKHDMHPEQKLQRLELKPVCLSRHIRTSRPNKLLHYDYDDSQRTITMEEASPDKIGV